MDTRIRRNRVLLLGLLALGLLAPPLHGEPSHARIGIDSATSVGAGVASGDRPAGDVCGLCLATGHARKVLEAPISANAAARPRAHVLLGHARACLTPEPFHDSPAAPRAPPLTA